MEPTWLHSTDAREAPVIEVFASIQGEGKYVGQPQVFLRLAGCPLRCRYCDTPGSWRIREGAQVRIDAPNGVRRENAWATPLEALQWIGAVEPGEPRPVSITGGEPLLWPDFILGLASMVGERPLHLETAGAHPEALLRVLPAIRHVSLDLKLPADMAAPEWAGGRPGQGEVPTDAEQWRETRRRALHLVANHDACTKLVVHGDAPVEAWQELLQDQADCAPRLPVYLQPVTPMGGLSAAPMETLVPLGEMARDLDLEVRVVPQMHRLLGVP